MKKIKTKRKKKDKTRNNYRKKKKTIKKFIGGGEGKDFWMIFFEKNIDKDFGDLGQGKSCECGSGRRFNKCNIFNDGKCIKLAEKAFNNREARKRAAATRGKKKSTPSKRLTTQQLSLLRAASGEEVYDESIPRKDGILISEAGTRIETFLQTMGVDLGAVHDTTTGIDVDPISFGINWHKQSHDEQLGNAHTEKSSDTARKEPSISISDLDKIFLMLNGIEMFRKILAYITDKVMNTGTNHLMGRDGVLITLYNLVKDSPSIKDLAVAAVARNSEISIKVTDPEWEILQYMFKELPVSLANPSSSDRRKIMNFLEDADHSGRANVELGLDALASLNGGIKYKSIPTVIVFNYLLSKFLNEKWKEKNIEHLAELIHSYRSINPEWITGKHKFEYLTMYYLRNADILNPEEAFVQYFKNQRAAGYRVYMEEYGETTQRFYRERKRLTLTQKIYDLGFCSSENRLFEIDSAIEKYNETLNRLYNTRDFTEEDLKSIIKEYDEKLTDSSQLDEVLGGRLQRWFRCTEEELDRSRTNKYAFLDDEIDIISVIWDQTRRHLAGTENIVDNLFNELYILHRGKYGDDINGYLDSLNKQKLIGVIMEIKNLYLRCLKLLREFYPRSIVVCKDLRTHVRVTGVKVPAVVDQLSSWGKDVHTLDYQNLGWIKLVLENNNEYNEVLSEDRRILIEHSMGYLINQLEEIYITRGMKIKDFQDKIRSFMVKPESTERVKLLFQYIEQNEELDGRQISLKTKYDIADLIIKRRQLESRRSLRDRFSSVLDRGTSVESTESTETVDSDGSFDHGDEEDQGERDVQAQQRREEAERLRAIELRDRFRNKYIDSSSSTFYDPEADPDPYDSLLEIDPLKYQVLDRFSGSEREQYIKKLACAAYTSKIDREEDMMDPFNKLNDRSTIKDNISELITKYGVDVVKNIIDNCSKNIKKRQKNFLTGILNKFKKGYQTTIMEKIIEKLFEKFSRGPGGDPSKLWSVNDLEDLVGKESERNLVPRQDFNKIITDILNNNVSLIEPSEFPGLYVSGEMGRAIYLGSTSDNQIVRHLYEMYVNEKVLQGYHTDEQVAIDELKKLKMDDLIDRAIKEGVDGDEIDAVIQSGGSPTEIQDAIITLILRASEEQSEALLRVDEEQEVVAELKRLSRGKLKKRAILEGVGKDEITVLSQRGLSPDREKGDIIQLILNARERQREEEDLDEI